MDKNYDEWNRHWSKLNELTEINPAQNYRHKILVNVIYNHVNRLPYKDSLIFDFGSGQGDLIRSLTKRLPGRVFCGLELSEVGVELSRLKNSNANFFVCNLLDEKKQLEDLFSRANFGICAEVLEHLDQPEIALANIKKYMAPKGILVITVPGGPMNEFEKSIGHRRHYSVSMLSNLAESQGFRIIKVYRAGFPFFNLYKIFGFLRGKKLLNDVGQKDGDGKLMKIALQLFSILFRFNFANSKFGWQLIMVLQKI